MADREENGRWIKGASANPRGRPRKGMALSDRLRKKLTAAEQAEVLDKLIQMAKKGDLAAIRVIFDRMDGLAVQRVESEAYVSLASDPQFKAIQKALLSIIDNHPELREELSEILP